MVSPGPWSAAVALLILSAIGCSQEKVNELIDQGKKTLDEGSKQVTQAVDQTKAAVNSSAAAAKETLQLSGKMELKADAPLATSACYVRLIPAHGDRPAILQLQSYRDAGAESFPSIFVQGSVDAENAAQLVGKTIDVQVFAQAAANGPVLSNPTAAPVQFKIVSADEQQIVGEFVGGQLQPTNRDTSVPVSGSVTGVWFSSATEGAAK